MKKVGKIKYLVGKRFGWSGDLTSTADTVTFTPTANMALNVNAESNFINVRITQSGTSNGNVRVSVNGGTPTAIGTIRLAKEMEHTIVASTVDASLYEVLGWSGDIESDSNTIKFTPTADMDLNILIESHTWSRVFEAEFRVTQRAMALVWNYTAANRNYIMQMNMLSGTAGGIPLQLSRNHQHYTGCRLGAEQHSYFQRQRRHRDDGSGRVRNKLYIAGKCIRARKPYLRRLEQSSQRKRGIARIRCND